MKIVIGISGKARHGKDTIADYLMSRLGGNKYHFADLLKEHAKLIGWDEEKDEGGRTLLQNLSLPIKEYGNWLAKKYPDKYKDYANNNYYAAATLNEILNSNDNISYIADLRLINEFNMLKNCKDIKFISIRVNRFNEDRTPFDNNLSIEQKNDNSETDLDNVYMNFKLSNFPKIEELYKQIDYIIPLIERIKEESNVK